MSDESDVVIPWTALASSQSKKTRNGHTVSIHLGESDFM